jgi:hypothetical protein
MFCAAGLLGGCSFTSDTLWPSLSGSSPSDGSAQAQTAQTQKVQIPPSPQEKSGQPLVNPGEAAPSAPPRLGSTNFVPPAVTPGTPTGTFVGQKVMQLRGELQRMQQQISQENARLQDIRRETIEHSQSYHTAVGAINARLQVGTTPGNPNLVSQWNIAQRSLARIDGDVANMNSLANDVAGTSTMSSYLLETTRAAYGLTGAVDEDHRQLAILEDEVNRTVVLIDRLLNELSEDINRQTVYVSNERNNLTTLALAIKNGELFGGSLSNRAYSSAAPVAGAGMSPTAYSNGAAPRRPLVVIRFDKPNVQYQQALHTAVSRALERRPQALFDLVAVASGRGSPGQVTVATNRAKRDAEAVLRTLSGMGLPMDRIRLSAITSPQADTNEVHIYVR